MAEMTHIVVDVIGIDGYLHHIHLVAIQINYQKPHAIAVRLYVDQGLIASLPARLANHPLPAPADALLDERVQFCAIDGPFEILNCSDVQTAHSTMR